MTIREAVKCRLWGGPRHWEIITLEPGDYPSNIVRMPVKPIPVSVIEKRARTMPNERPPIATYCVELADDGTPKLNPGLSLPGERGLGAAKFDRSGW
jgi:hypothetical protein